MKQNQKKRLLMWLGVIGFIIVFFLWSEPEYAFIPSKQDIKQPSASQFVMEEGEDQQLKLGKQLFYKATFNNELFFTDILGLFDGPIKVTTLFKEIYNLQGEGTDNLKITLPETVKIGGKTFEKGTKLNTGIDVPKDSYVPLGMKFKYQEGRIKVGISCAFCHATVDREGQVIQGAPNSNLNTGLLLAMASNSSAYFTHTDVTPLLDYLKGDKKILNSKEEKTTLPEGKKFEEAVDRSLLNLAPGNFDFTNDLKHNPAQIPDLFTKGDHPYGWNGFAAYGDYFGLTTITNQMHTRLADPLSQSNMISEVYGIDKEVYIGTILQNAPDQKLKLRGMYPSVFWDKNKPPTDSPGVLDSIKAPNWPKGSPETPDGLILGSKKFKTGEEVNALSKWQNSLMPPAYQSSVKDDQKRKVMVNEGKKIFQNAGCINCHAGDSYSSNRIISVKEIQTESSRAKSFIKLKDYYSKPVQFKDGEKIPVPDDGKTELSTLTGTDPESFAYVYDKNKVGGYKTKGLIGLYLSAPYLHDGGVAVGYGPNEWGVTGTLLQNRPVDPVKSLKALLDREWRKKVIRANAQSSRLLNTHVTGEGHPYWVDEVNGYTEQEQRSLIEYLLSLDKPGK